MFNMIVTEKLSTIKKRDKMVKYKELALRIKPAQILANLFLLGQVRDRTEKVEKKRLATMTRRCKKLNSDHKWTNFYANRTLSITKVWLKRTTIPNLCNSQF